jgi:hypothetical protein
MRRGAIRVSLMMFAAVEVGCASFDPPPVEGLVASAAQKRGLEEARVEHGHELYITACVKCHRPVRPDSFSEANWDDILPKMVKRAKLDEQSHQDIRAYVFSVRDAMIEAKEEQKLQEQNQKEMK